MREPILPNVRLNWFAYRIHIGVSIFLIAGFLYYTYYFIHDKLPGNKAGNCQSCQVAENRVRRQILLYDPIAIGLEKAHDTN